MTSATCSVPAACTASGGYDGTAGKPAGSLAASSSIIVNAGGLFKAKVIEESPDFKVTDEGPGALRLDRQFVPGGLAELTPQVKYTVSLLDKTAGTDAQPITETVTVAPAFAGREGAVTLTKGHLYAIRIESEIDTNAVGVGIVGTTTARFDNVVLAPVSEGGRGGISDSKLATLIRSSLIGPAVLKGKRLFVKAKCPAAVGTACRISIQGLLSKKKPATGTRTARVAKGKTKRFALRVKPKARPKLVNRKRLLFKATVRAGGAKATVFKSLRLIRR